MIKHRLFHNPCFFNLSHVFMIAHLWAPLPLDKAVSFLTANAAPGSLDREAPLPLPSPDLPRYAGAAMMATPSRPETLLPNGAQALV